MDESTQTAVMAAIQRHIDTRYGHRDDAAHLATYASDAYLAVGDRGYRKREVRDVDVLAAWREAPEHREPHLAAPSLVEWRPEGDGLGIAVVDLREAETGTPLVVAYGMKREDDAWKVGWASLVKATPRSFAHQEMMAVAELAGLRAATAAGPVTSLLEAGYVREHRLPRTRLLALPETRFSCQGTGACCRHELTIGLDENSVAFVNAVDWPALNPGLGQGPYTEPMPEAAASLVSFKHKLAREADGRCRFLDERNRCMIHGLAGRAVFKPCHVFPYRFAWTPDGVAVTTNAMCPTARACQGLPLSAQEEDLRSRLAVADLLKVDKYYMLPNQEISWETFRTVEGTLLGLLGGEGAPPGHADAPVRQRLWVALRWLEARVRDPQAGVDASWYLEPIPRLGWLQRKAFESFTKLFDPCFKDLRQAEAGEGVLPEFEEEVARWLRSLLFSKALTYPYGLVAGMNYLALTYMVLERQVAKHAARGISEDFWREFYAVVTSGTYLRILQACHMNPATRFARHVGVPTFGRTLLGTGA